MTIIQKYLSYLRYEKNYSLHTEISYSKDISQFEEFLKTCDENIGLLQADGDIVRMWVASLMESGVSARSVNRKLSSLKSFYRYLVRTGEIPATPLAKIAGPKTKKPLPSFINYSDMEPVLDGEYVSNVDFEEYRNRVILELFYVTGMRRAELINLKDTDVDLFKNQISVTGKRNKQRLVPFSGGTRELIDGYLAKRNEVVSNHSGRFFVKNNGEPLYPMLVYRIVAKMLEVVSTLEKKSPHVLRHSFATGMLNNGAEINAVKELLGHSSLASTEVYTHTSFEELKKIYDKSHPRA